MKTIWSFKTPFEAKFIIEMPKGAEILTIQQHKKTLVPTLWAKVDTDNPTEERCFELFGTGLEIPSDMGVERKYVGTYQYQNGEFVGHLFERIN